MINKPFVFVTGATSGIGRATAQLFAKHQFPVILNGRRQERLDEMAAQLDKVTEVLTAPFDVCDSSQVEVWFQEHAAVVDRIGVLVNNAGLARGTDPLQSGQLSDWNEMIDTNIKGLLTITRKILPSMAHRREGHVVNLGSVAGRWTYAGGAVYCATKFAVRALSEGMRVDLLGKNVRVTNIEPGMVETEFSEVRFRDKDKAGQVYKGMKPLSPQDIAETIYWCVNRPAHVNIQELVVFPTDQASIRDVYRE